MSLKYDSEFMSCTTQIQICSSPDMHAIFLIGHYTPIHQFQSTKSSGSDFFSMHQFLLRSQFLIVKPYISLFLYYKGKLK